VDEVQEAAENRAGDAGAAIFRLSPAQGLPGLAISFAWPVLP